MHELFINSSQACVSKCSYTRNRSADCPYVLSVPAVKTIFRMNFDARNLYMKPCKVLTDILSRIHFGSKRKGEPYRSTSIEQSRRSLATTTFFGFRIPCSFPILQLSTITGSARDNYSWVKAHKNKWLPLAPREESTSVKQSRRT